MGPLIDFNTFQNCIQFIDMTLLIIGVKMESWLGERIHLVNIPVTYNNITYLFYEDELILKLSLANTIGSNWSKVKFELLELKL